MLIDTHSHLFVEEFDEDRDEMMQRAKESGVSRIYMPNIDSASLSSLLEVCSRYAGYCFPMLGLHPTSIDNSFRQELETLKAALVEGHPFVGIGEVGLDLYWDKTFLKEQQTALDEQIQWALEWNLPLIVHCRDAYPELYTSLLPYKKEGLRGIFHCFSGTSADADRLMEFGGFCFGVNGTVTYKKSILPEILAAHIPVERLVLETDSPYLPPVPYRGKRNESSYIVEVCKRVAQIYDISVEELAYRTAKNAEDLFQSVQKSQLVY